MSASVCSQRSRMDMMPGSQSTIGQSTGSSFHCASNPTESFTCARRRAVSRALFPCPPGSISDDYARNKLREIQQEDSKKYNFDFDREVPLPGRWKWQPVELSPQSSSSAPPPVPRRLLPKTTIAVAPLFIVPAAAVEDETLSITQTTETHFTPIAAAQPSTSTSTLHPPPPPHEEEEDCISGTSANADDRIRDRPQTPMTVQAVLELPHGSATRPLKRESSLTAINKSKPKLKQPKLNQYYNEVKRSSRRVTSSTKKKC